MKKVDFIIVGQGIAGSMIAWFLKQHRQSFIVIDKQRTPTASTIAAGVINPVTGRKMVKTWKIDDVLPFAKQTYREMESELGVRFFYEQEIYKIFTSTEDIGIWNHRKDDVAYTNYIGDIVTLDESGVEAPFGAGIIKNACWLDMPIFTQSIRNYLLENGCLIDEEVNYDTLKIGEQITYQNWEAQHIIFCEGFRADSNPFFPNLPFTFAKGEQLLIHSTALNTNKILNRNIFVIPKGNHTYQVGATYVWNDMTEQITNEGRLELTEKLEKLMSCSYDILEEKAAIRPTTKDRRPFVDQHPIHKNLYIFNGMGTKGISLSPFFANHFIDCILKDKPIMQEILLNRFLV